MKLAKLLLAPHPQPGTLAVEAMISEQNTALSLGVDVKLVVHQEDEQDRQARPDLYGGFGVNFILASNEF